MAGHHRWGRVAFYTSYAWRFIVLRHSDPLIYGIAVTDHCNLACRGCTVANTGRRSMTWEETLDSMSDAYRRGYRELYFSGGEPTLWHDGARSLDDLIAAAREIGFFHVHVYTNGLRGVPEEADLIWVSMDGLPDTFARRRGDHFARVEEAVRNSPHHRIAVIYVVDRSTASGIEDFLRWVQNTRFPVLGVMVYFHTPYYGYDDLYLTQGERSPIIDRLQRCIREGLPLLNSRAGLRALQAGDWPRRLPLAAVRDIEGEWSCCRAPDAVCEACGYAACTELTEVQRLRPSAVRAMLKYW